MKKVLVSFLGLFLFLSINSTVFAATIYWPTSSKEVTSEYGWRIHPLTGVRTMHYGLDIGALRKDSNGKGIAGDPIKAMHNGVVKNAGWNTQGYGNLVQIDHVGANQMNYKNVQSVYAHLNSISVSSGQSVSGGTTIGTMGATGNVTGVHLHFETRDCATSACSTSMSDGHNPRGWYSGIATFTADNLHLIDENHVLSDVELSFEKPYFYSIEDLKTMTPEELVEIGYPNPYEFQ